MHLFGWCFFFSYVDVGLGMVFRIMTGMFYFVASGYCHVVCVFCVSRVPCVRLCVHAWL